MTATATATIQHPLAHRHQSPDRLLQASSRMRQKEANNPQTDKIRLIHLYEADLKLVWKLIWGSRLVQLAELNNLYPDAQYSSQPCRNAIEAVLAKTLRYEFSRVAQTNMALMDNDAKANYNRIVYSISSIACQMTWHAHHAQSSGTMPQRHTALTSV
jgi:hypothetical protein